MDLSSLLLAWCRKVCSSYMDPVAALCLMRLHACRNPSIPDEDFSPGQICRRVQGSVNQDTSVCQRKLCENALLPSHHLRAIMDCEPLDRRSFPSVQQMGRQNSVHMALSSRERKQIQFLRLLNSADPDCYQGCRGPAWTPWPRRFWPGLARKSMTGPAIGMAPPRK